MNAYPNKLSKKLLGYGTSIDGTDDTMLPIYEYTLLAPNRPSSKEKPIKILLMTGIHGEEKASVWGSLQFFKQMLDNADSDESLTSIKANVDFKIIPILNPYGFNNHIRTNSREVDLNRNFSYRWEENSSTVKGTEPYSEKETQILKDWLMTNNNANIFIDFHNFSLGKPDLAYLNTPSEKNSKCLFKLN